MSKKDPPKTGQSEHGDRRKEILELCYGRLKEMIPECGNEVTLLKCIEILEKQHDPPASVAENEKTLHVIADTLDRLAAIRKADP